MSTDPNLWQRIHEGDQQAYAQLYRTLYRQLYNYGCKFTAEVQQVEDSIQETLLYLWNRRSDIPTIEHPQTYFFSVFRYGLFRRLKAARGLFAEGKSPVDPDSDTVSHEWEPEFNADYLLIQKEMAREQSEQLQRALAALTSRQREAIFLRFYQGMSYEEVADLLQITTKATYKIMARALEELRRQLGISASLLLSWLQAGA